MMFNKRLFALLSVALLLWAAGCAEDVGDIDRTQPNALKKAEFEGVWYMRQTITDVPPSVGGLFVGISSPMEKVRWEIQENYLIAYRAYEEVPGWDQDAGGVEDGETTYREGVEEGRNPEYKEEPVAVYPIVSHFDIQRSYSASTGEQTNVIQENASDRPWDEREYMRVEWSQNMVDLSLPAFIDNISASEFYVQQREDGPDAFYTERRDAQDGDMLAYFDFVTRYNFDGSEMEMRSSFLRLEEYQRDYQPVFYDDEMMTKFGYFRTERFTYDRGRGLTDSGRIYLANRHDIWANDFKRAEDGSYLRDSEGRRIPTPMAEREPKPIAYHLSPGYPERMLPGAERVVADWDRAFTRAAAAAKGMSVSDFTERYGPMFLLCPNVVTEDDPAACDPRPPRARVVDGQYEPFVAKRGDLRLSTIDWVHQPQASGPLGYGPSYPDPETGEIVSGTAYVYGAGVDTYAEFGVDVVKFINGDLSEEELQQGGYARDYILEQLNPAIDPRARSAQLEALGANDIAPRELHDALLDERTRGIFSDVRERGLEHLAIDPTYRQRKLQRIKEAGLDQQLISNELLQNVLDNDDPVTEVTQEQIEAILEDHNPIDIVQQPLRDAIRLEKAARHNVYLAEFADSAVMGTALRFEGRTDYDAIRDEIRNEIYQGVMAHEVGHTIGLRHNFQGSYDSLNYHDNYWALRRDTFGIPNGIDEFYEFSEATENQAKGLLADGTPVDPEQNAGIREYQYSSIMDYHARFNGDWAGIGKYDEAAVLFAYSFGTYDDLDQNNQQPIPVDEGFVEVYNTIPDNAQVPIFQGSVNTRSFLHSYDSRYNAAQHPLEDYHYSTVVALMGGIDNLSDRSLVKYSDLKPLQESGDEDRPVEVQYMFCSDEWAGAAISCDRWDLGADPFEVTRSAIVDYKAYYPFTHFRRDRLNFNYLSGAARATRAFNKMPAVYQRWFFNQYYNSGPILDNYFLFAAFSGFNFLAEVIAMPQYGGYAYDSSSDTYRLASTSKNCQENTDIDLCVDPGAGRNLYTQYDYGSGYYYFTRVTETGHYWDAIFAMSAMTASVATAIGVDTTGDLRSYLLPYFLVFEDELTTMFNGMVRGETDSYAPVAENGRLRFRPAVTLGLSGGGELDPFTGEVLTGGGEPVGGEKKLDVRMAWTQRIYSLLYGISFFNSNYSQRYIDQARVFRIGNGEQMVANAGDGFEVISFTDPSTGIEYGAIAPINAAEEDLSLAAKLIVEGQRYAEALAAGDSDAGFDLDNVVEEINRVASAVELLGQAPL